MTPQSFTFSRRRALRAVTCAAAAALLAAAGLTAAHAQTAAPGPSAAPKGSAFPTRPITLVIGYAPGGGTDIVGRVLARELENVLGQPVVVDNKAGAGTLIATEYVARAPADGYTLFFATNGMVINSLLKDPAPYDVVKDFAPVGMVTVQSLALIVRPGLDIHSVKDLIAYAKARPGKLNFASSGHGNAQHVAGEAFAAATGIDIVHVPYKGAGPAIQDLIAGRVDMMFTGLLGLKDHIAAKRMILLATTGQSRTPATPDVPSVSEAAGIPDYTVDSWQAIFAPAGTPQAVIDRLSQALQQVGQAGRLADRFKDEGMDVRVSTPQALHDFIVKDRRQLAGIVDRIKK
jgi:tripartite-type tricarboxylate transporter receptor subunit TctC